MSDFSKNLTFLTNLANILNFICQICKFFKQSSPTSQPSVAHRFIKILKSHTSICKTKSTPFLACTVFILPLQECREYTAVHHNRVWVSHPYCHSERSEESSVAKCGLCLDSSTLLGMTMGRMQLNRGGCHAILPIKLQYQALLSNTRLFPSKSIFTLSPDEISALISFSLSLSSTSLWSVLLNGLAPYSAS